MAGQIAAFLLLVALLPASLAAQDRGASTQEMVDKAKQSYGPAPPKPRCDKESQDPDVIVVCGELEEQEQFRVRSDEDAENDYARETMNKGAAPPPPNVDGDGIFKGPATFKLAPPVAPLIIDLEDIPDAPEGSDADRIGKGEKGS
ncbi:MAG TPA: hypothetical protein VL100_06610 [Croceibacterium sp.]|nr:hypothetical protein [Croceibacterium sp.]